MNNATRSWKTTALGVLSILGVIIPAAKAMIAGQSIDLLTLWPGIAAGLGLIAAKDGSVTGTATTKPSLPSISPVIAAFALLGIVTFARPAMAQDAPPTPSQLLGGCNATGKVCWGPELAISLTAVDTRTGHVQAAFDPGLGYGLTFWRGTSHELGVGGYAMFRTGEDESAMVSIIGSFNNYLRFGFARVPIGKVQDNFVLLGIGTSL